MSMNNTIFGFTEAQITELGMTYGIGLLMIIDDVYCRKTGLGLQGWKVWDVYFICRFRVRFGWVSSKILYSEYG